MNGMLMLASACMVFAALWSIPPVREYAASWLPNPFDDFADRWLGAVLSVWMALFFIVGVSRLSAYGGLAGPRSCDGLVSEGDSKGPGPPAPPGGGQVVAGRVVTRDPAGKMTPVTIGQARIGQSESPLAADGGFQLNLPETPQPDTLLEVDSSDYVSRFLRLDDLTLVRRRPIELEPKKRIMVIPAKVADRNNGYDEIRRSMENQFTEDGIELVADDKQRDEVVERLYAYQQNGALYDPKTLARVGNFYGASDGVFWSLIDGADFFTIECRLVNLSTAKIEYTVNARFKKGVPLAGASEAAADLLLSQMARAEILSPKDTANVIRNISVRGYSVNIPKSWTLWIAVLPEGNDRLFPQRRLSAHGDQSFYAPDVYAGEATLPRQTRFSIYTVLADPAYSQAIQSYIDNQVQGGLDMNSWDKAHCKLLNHITVNRKQ